MRAFAALVLAVALTGCKAKVPAITQPFSDDFERADLGPAWHNTGGPYRVKEGKLNVSLAHNHPLWLRQRLPADAVIELDVMSKDPSGDLKVEIFGDGESFDPDQGQYDPSGYVLIFGGWNNALSIIGRKGEHDAAVKVSRGEPRVEVGRTYRWTITRRGGTIDWVIDGQPFLSWTDPEPLKGERHQYFGVNNWKADVYFDNLKIRPAP